MPRADVVLNPISGSAARGSAVAAFREALERRGWDVRLRPTERAGHAAALAREAAAEGSAAVVAAGGDGTINEVASGLLACGPGAPPLGLLPRGTSNLVARDLRVPLDAAGAAGIVADGHVRTIDSADVGGRPMFACAGAGWDAQVVRELAARRRGHITISSWFAPIRAAVRGYAFPPIRVSADGGAPVECVSAIVLNCRPYARFFDPCPAARPDDGLLDAVLVRPEGRRRLARLAWRAWRGTMGADPHVVTLRGAVLRVESDSPVPVQVDGDAGGECPVTIAVRPASLRVLAPPASRKT